MSVELEEWSWPPPGLERLRGVLRTAARRGAFGTVLAGVPLLWLLLDPGIDESETLAAITALAIATGILAYLGGILRAAAALDLARQGARLGYPRPLLLDVLADRGDDTPALIAATGPYAELRPRIRDTMRALRRAAALTALAGALLPLPLFCIGVWLALRGAAAPLSVALLLLAPALLLWITTAVLRGYALLLAQWERGAAAWDPAPVSERERAAAWRARFAPDATHAAARPTGLLALVAVAGGGIVAFVFLFVTAVIVGMLSGALEDGSYARVTLTPREATHIELLRALRTPTDTTITADSAGRALHAYLTAAGDTMTGMRAATALPPLRIDAPVHGPGALWNILTTVGDVPPPIAALQDAPAHPALAALHTLARAPSVDPLTARWDSAPSPLVWYRGPPGDAATLRAVTDAANAWRRGDRATARAILRDLLSAGLLLLDHARSPAEFRLAADMVNTAGALLLRAEPDPGLHAADSAAARAQRRTGTPPPHRDTQLTRRIGDVSLYPALRWEAFRLLHLREHCGSLAALLFADGTAPSFALAGARQQLVQSPGDSLALAALTSRAPPFARGSRWYRRIERAVRAVSGDHLLANPCFAAAVRGW